jgi:hypothetical protein
MSELYRQLANSSASDFSVIPSIIEFFEKEANEALSQFAVKGNRITEVSSRLPGLLANRSVQLSELEAIFDIMQKRLDKVRYERFRFFMEQYDRQLTSRDAEKFAEGDDNVFAVAMICNEIGLLRDIFKSIVKGLVALGYSVSVISNLRQTGNEEATL